MNRWLAWIPLLFLAFGCQGLRGTEQASAKKTPKNNRITSFGEPMGASVGNGDKVIFRGSDNEVIFEYLNAFFRSKDSKDVLIVEGDGNTYRMTHSNVIDNSVGSCDTIILRGDRNHIQMLNSYFMDNRQGHDTTVVREMNDSYRLLDVSGIAILSVSDSTENKLSHVWLSIDEVISQYGKAAASGDAMSAYYLGELFQQGVGVPVQPAKALYYYQIAADAGLREAMLALGYLYEGHYVGVPHDTELAAHWYDLAAKKGDPSAVQRERGKK